MYIYELYICKMGILDRGVSLGTNNWTISSLPVHLIKIKKNTGHIWGLHVGPRPRGKKCGVYFGSNHRAHTYT